MNREHHPRLRRVGASLALGALAASSLFGATPPAYAATVTTVKVTNADIRPDETTYAGWHQGYSNAAYASAITSKGLESIGRSQILYGYANNSNSGLAADGVNADLSASLVGASYDVKAGTAFLQVPLFADLDGPGAGDGVFTTLRPASGATAATTVAAGDLWMSSKTLGTIAANTALPLSQIITTIEAGTYKTIGIGVLTDVGQTSTVSSITFSGKKFVFTATSATETIRNSQLKGEETSSNYTSWHQGYENATLNAQVSAAGLELAGKSQVIKGLNNKSANVKAVNVNLRFAIPEASYTVAKGTAFFQIPVFFDNGNGVKFATLRNGGEGVGTNNLALADKWQSSKDLGTIAANTDATLSDIIDALGAYKVIGYGVLTNAGDSAIVSSITFAGTTTTFADAPAAPSTTAVVPGSIAPDESEYAGWHQGATPTVGASIIGDALNLGAERSQVINGYENNSANTNASNVDLAEALRTGSYDVVSGDVYFQVPLFFEDANGDTKFATLRPAVKAHTGSNTFSLGDEWMSSKDIGSLKANTPGLLGDILSSLGSYKVLAFGVYSDAGGNGVVKSITWDGVKTVFERAASTTTAHFSPTTTSKKRFWVYVKVTSAGGSVVGGAVKLTCSGHTLATGTVGANGEVKMRLTRTIHKGVRSMTVTYAGTTTTKASSHTYSVRVK